MWYETEESQMQSSEIVMDSFSRMLSNFTIFPLVGNHGITQGYVYIV